jgi:hypothetical protein
MKGLRYSIVAAAMVAGSFGSVKAQTADEIVQKHITAIGGADNWKKINSMRMTGSISAQGVELPIVLTMIPNKAERVEFTLNGITGYSIITKTEGWSYVPFAGQQKPEALPAEALKDAQESLDIQPLIDYKTKGNKITFLGKDDVEGTEVYKVKLVYKSGKEETMYFDASNYYHIKSVEKSKANGKEVEQVSTYSNYTKLPEGIVYPMNMDTGEGPMTVKSVEINKPVDEKIFKPSN